MFRSPKDFVLLDKANDIKKNIEYGYICDICGQGPWSTELDVEIHRKNTHKQGLMKALKDESISMCSICLRVQPTKKALIEHILVNHFCSSPNATTINREIFICDHCNRLFFNKQLLIMHIYHWHTIKSLENQLTTYQCPKCCKTIRGKTTWFHLLHHDIFNVGTCPICLKTCENHSEMIEHLKIHPGHFKCNICQYETTKETYFNNHILKHKKKVEVDDFGDVSRFFLPEPMGPSFSNRMAHIFKGIPLANEISICILCRALCTSEEGMRQHIYGEHEPEEKEKSKLHQCLCGEKFFNRVLLKQHIFKLQGNHGIWDGEITLLDPNEENPDEQIVYQVFEISDSVSVGANEIFIKCLPEDGNSGDTQISSKQSILRDFEEMET